MSDLFSSYLNFSTMYLTFAVFREAVNLQLNQVWLPRTNFIHLSAVAVYSEAIFLLLKLASKY